jgi:hypothetical protein
MQEHRSGIPERGDRNPSWSLRTIVTLGPAGIILAVSAAALVDYGLTAAIPHLTWPLRTLIVTAIVGLLAVLAVVAVHRFRTAPGQGQGHRQGPGREQPPDLVPSPRRLDHLDDELIRLIDRERLRGF